MLTIDGGDGEGGGQILRLALALAMATGTAFRIDKIRSRRDKPGMLRQHISCVRAAQAISDARSLGDHLGSGTLVFEPRAIKGGSFDFPLAAAGATTLVLHMVLPALLLADTASRLTITGGTHVPHAPTFDHVTEVYLPQLKRMGVDVDCKLLRAGFSPAGGGKLSVRVTPPRKLLPLALDDDGPVKLLRIRTLVSNLPFEIAEREAAHAVKLLSWPAETAEPRGIDADGPGNLIAVTVGTETAAEMFTGFGALNISAEAMAEHTIAGVRDHLAAKVPVGPYLAEQLLVPMAMAGSGSFVTGAPSRHTRTAIGLIEKFLPVEIEATPLDDLRWRITIAS